MTTGHLLLNPYRPVALDEAPHLQTVNPYAGVDVVVHKGWMYREFQLFGFVETDIVWDARGTREFVSVDGISAAGRLSFLYVPRFEFEIPTRDGPLNGLLEVRVKWLFFVSGIRLTIGENTVFCEGCFAQATTQKN